MTPGSDSHLPGVFISQAMKKAIISIAVIVLIAGAVFAARPKTAYFSGYTGYLVKETSNSRSCIRIPGAEISVITSQGDTLRTVSDETASFVIPQTPEGPAKAVILPFLQDA